MDKTIFAQPLMYKQICQQEYVLKIIVSQAQQGRSGEAAGF